MMLRKCYFILSVLCFLSFSARAKVSVITTTTNLKSLVEEIGGGEVDVQSFSRGTQDPHYLEAKPSFMIKASRADLLVSVGLDLEVGWLPLIIRGARAPHLRIGESGHLVAGNHIQTLGKPEGQVSRAQGDVHPAGNPHFMLDPKRALIIGEKVSEKLSQILPKKKDFFRKKFLKFKAKINKKLSKWKKAIPRDKKVITYHKTLTYFYHRFGIKNIAILEPKPGIPPSASHVIEVMKKAKKEGVKLALVENYFDPTVANRVAQDVQDLKVEVVPVAVGGEKGIKTLFDLYERLVNVLRKE